MKRMQIGFPLTWQKEIESSWKALCVSTTVGLVMKGINSQIFIDQNQVLATDEDEALIKEPQNSSRYLILINGLEVL